MARRELPGASKQVASNVRDAISALVGECLNSSAIGATTDAVAAVACALEAMTTNHDAEGLHKMAITARAYLRKRGIPTIAPEPHEVVRGMVLDAGDALARREEPKKLALILTDWLPHWGLRAFGVPDAFHAAKLAGELTERYSEWSWAPQDLQKRVTPHVTDAVENGADAEGIVVATLVGYGLTRRRARDMVKSAFRNQARPPKRPRG